MRSAATVHREHCRRATAERFLLALEDIAWRYRTVETGHGIDRLEELRIEAITIEVAHQLELARAAVRRFS